jgi:hypothetical protein
VWLDVGLDLRLKPYRVIATGVNRYGEGVGMLQIVNLLFVCSRFKHF